MPDCQPFYRRTFYYATPGAPNNGGAAPLEVYINEWMAANTRTSGFLDPADGNDDDWFELHNASSTNVDLVGYYLTDNLLNRTQYRIPPGYAIPAGGFLLVWADNEPGQNQPGRPDLHVNFRLNQDGEAIGLFAPDGAPIDAVTFGSQTNNLSEGRYPDGTGPRHFMTTPTPRAANRVSTPPVTVPEFSEVTLVANGVVQFTFSTVVGQTYRVEYSEDLNSAVWIPLGNDHAGTGANVIIQDTIGPSRQRFYRIVLAP